MQNKTQQQWYEFAAYNSGAIYGYGTEAEAEKYCDHLNKGREINLYAAAPAEGEDGEYCDTWNNIEDELAAVATEAEKQEYNTHHEARTL